MFFSKSNNEQEYKQAVLLWNTLYRCETKELTESMESSKKINRDLTAQIKILNEEILALNDKIKIAEDIVEAVTRKS